MASASAMDDNGEFNYLQASISGKQKLNKKLYYEDCFPFFSFTLIIVIPYLFVFLQQWMKD